MPASLWACKATASAACCTPTTVPGPPGISKPTIALPGETPRSPVTMVGPELVTVEPPRTAKLSAVPKVGAVATACETLTLMPRAKASTRPASRRTIGPLVLCITLLSDISYVPKRDYPTNTSVPVCVRPWRRREGEAGKDVRNARSYGNVQESLLREGFLRCFFGQ